MKYVFVDESGEDYLYWRKAKPTLLLHMLCLVMLCLACKQTKSPVEPSSVIDSAPDSSAVVTPPEIKGDFTIFEHDLSMYNQIYQLRIRPSIDSIRHKYESVILLTKKSATIFKKTINIDSLGQTILRHKIFPDSADHARITTDYELRKVVWHGVRTDDLYFVAEIVSHEDEKKLQVLFQITYLNQIGKLFVNGFSERGWGENEGERESKGNRKFLNQNL